MLLECKARGSGTAGFKVTNLLLNFVYQFLYHVESNCYLKIEHIFCDRFTLKLHYTVEYWWTLPAICGVSV